MWVKLNCIKRLAGENALDVTHYPGEWVNAPKGLARSWVLANDASYPDPSKGKVLTGCGVYAYNTLTPLREKLAPMVSVLGLTIEKPDHDSLPDLKLPFPMSLLWDGEATLNPDLIAFGFSLLDTWEVAIPLRPYDILAKDIGGEEDRKLTKQTLQELRIPVYDSRCVYVRRGATSDRFIETWESELNKGQNSNIDLALLRAIYTAKPLILALPCTWVLSH